MSSKKLRFQHLALVLTAALLFTAAGPLRVWFAHGARLGARSVQLSNSRVSASTSYTVSFTGQSGGSVGSVRAQFCANDPIIGTPCTPPTGFDISAATLAAQTGMTGFIIDAVDTTANVLVLARVPGAAPAGNSTYTLTGVTNPDTVGSYYVRLETFASINATGSDVDYGGLAFTINQVLQISTVVPPYLLMCAGITIQFRDCARAEGNYIDLGELSSSITRTGKTELLLATNSDGYTLRVLGNTLTSGNNTIPALSTSDVSRTSTSQFGLNLRANTTPLIGDDVQGPGGGTVTPAYDNPNFYRFNSGEVIASAPAADDYRLYTASYIVNIARDQPAGVYVSTITYVGLANF